MLTVTHKETYAYQERFATLRHEADEWRLVRDVLGTRKKAIRWHGRALIWLGRRLTMWGWHLQKRYDPRTAANPALSMNDG